MGSKPVSKPAWHNLFAHVVLHQDGHSDVKSSTSMASLAQHDTCQTSPVHRHGESARLLIVAHD